MTLLSERGRGWLAWVIGVAFFTAPAWGQTARSATLPVSVQAVLIEMAGHAAIIFTGEVTAVSRADASGYVDVKFRVDQPVRGVKKTGAYVLREWAGLWMGGVERYRVGQKFLMLLAARGSSGMSAPVDGTDGAIPLAAAGDSPLIGGNGDAPADRAMEAPEVQVDLRWLAARAMRTTAAMGHAEKSGAGTLIAVPGFELEAGIGGRGGGRWIASPVLGPVDGGEGGGDGEGWVGAVAPLPGARGSALAAESYPAATKLSSILALLSNGSGSAAHASR